MNKQIYEKALNKCWSQFCETYPTLSKTYPVQKVFNFIFNHIHQNDKKLNEDYFAKLDAHENNFVSKKPKFRKGNKVKVINYDGGLPSLARCIGKIFTVSDVQWVGNYQYMYGLETDEWLFDERDYLKSIRWCEHFLKLCEESNQSTEPHSLSQNVTNCDKSSDNAINVNLLQERRLNIAAMIEPALISNPDLWKRCGNYYAGPGKNTAHSFAELALEYADALISKVDKGKDK